MMMKTKTMTLQEIGEAITEKKMEIEYRKKELAGLDNQIADHEQVILELEQEIYMLENTQADEEETDEE